MANPEPSAVRPQPVRRDRRRLGAAAVAIGLLGIGFAVASSLSVKPPGGVPTSPSGSTPGDGLAGRGQPGLPALDPEPWTTVTWRVIPDAIAHRLAGGPDRIDGVVDTGAGLIGWGRISQPGRNQFNDMGAIHLSRDGVAWHVVTMDAGVGPQDTSEIHHVAVGPAGVLAIGGVCCTGEERPAAWGSNDGLAWQRLPLAAENVLESITRLIATPERYVLAGQLNGQARISSSVDGITWETAKGGEGGLGRGSVEDVAAAANGLMAVGRVEDDEGRYDGALWTSQDGVTWTRERVAVLEGVPDTIVSRVVPWTGGLLLIGWEGDHGDRVRCEQAGSLAGPGPAPPGSRDFSCAWGGEVHWVRRDGGNWQRVVPAGGLAGAAPRAGELIEFRLVTAGGPGLVILGEGLDDGGPSIFVSADGITWQPTAPRPQWPEGVVPAGFVVRGRSIVGVGDGPTVQIGAVH